METREHEKMLDKIKNAAIPRHVAIIMDGNGRWAAKRGLPRIIGHRAGTETVRDIIKAAAGIGIEFMTLYAFSTENWKRPAAEISGLMSLLLEYCAKEIAELMKNNVRLEVIGRVSGLPIRIQNAVLDITRKTAASTGIRVMVALNYGGRAEIIDAVRALLGDLKVGRIKEDDISEGLFGSYLYTKGVPDPDLLIRSSGECRLSNFLLWQVAYSEFWVTPVLWPDFRPHHLYEAIYDYQGRERRFGSSHSAKE